MDLPESFGSFADFRSASDALLSYLRERFGFSLWMVTRVAGDDWVVLDALDNGYGVRPGDVFRWTDSFCSRMVQGHGPCIAPRSDDIPAYAEAPIGRQVPIGAYIGVPLTWPDGTVFGTLCAIDPDAKPEELTEELPQVQMLARLLSTVLATELHRDEARRRAERAETEAMTDAMTELYNRRGWDRLLAAEEARCARYGHEAAVISLDLDDLKAVNDSLGHEAGDELIRQAAGILQATARHSDIIARVGGDEFAVLAVNTSDAAADQFVTRIQQNLDAASIRASIGSEARRATANLYEAWQEADRRMYLAKSARKPGHRGQSSVTA